MAQNTAANIAAFVNTVYANAWLVARDNAFLPGIITQFGDQSGTALRKSSNYGTATMQSLGETDDLASQTFSPTVDSTLTPGELGAQFFVTDLRVETDTFSVMQDAAAELGQAYAEKVETDIGDQFSSLSGGTVGAAGSSLSWGYFYAMLSRLRNTKAPRPYYFVCHPHQWHQLGKAASVGSSSATNAADSLKEDINQNFYLGTVSGVNIFTSSNLTVDASDDAVAAMFSPLALAIDWRRPFRIEWERDSSRRGWELNASTVYAKGVWRPAWGIQATFDAAAPTI